MFRRFSKSVLVAICLLPCAEVAEADSAARQRAENFATLPDWTGLWESEAWSDITVGGRPAGGMAAVRAKSALAAHPPYNAVWEARYAEALKDTAALAAAAETTKICKFGFPGALESPSVFEMLVTPEQTAFIFTTPEVRHVYTDGRAHPGPDSLWPTLMGHSIGHWEGHTLVIETVARDSAAPLRFSSPFLKLSEQARYTERIRLVGPDSLVNEMTIEDPVALARPWHLVLRHRRVKNLDRILPYDCAENDRNPVIDGQLTISPP